MVFPLFCVTKILCSLVILAELVLYLQRKYVPARSLELWAYRDFTLFALLSMTFDLNSFKCVCSNYFTTLLVFYLYEHHTVG